MPVAIPVRKHFGSSPSLEHVVECVCAVADTLATLAKEGIYHRDIKPENLYRWHDTWCVGDFGLVDYPDKQEVTEAGTLVGPRHYLAPELFASPDVPAGPTDVYALGKTLWVLATGQTFPLPGHLSADMRAFKISSYVAHPRVRQLELLVARCTSPDPDVRPTMVLVAMELHAWSAPRDKAPAVYPLSLLGDRLRPLVRAQLDAKRAREEHQTYVLARLEEITLALGDVREVIKDTTGLIPQHGAFSIFTECPAMVLLLPMAGVVYRHHIALMVTCPRVDGDVVRDVDLLSGMVVSAMRDSTLELVAAHQVHLGGPRAHKQVWVATATVARESALEQHSIGALVRQLEQTLEQALEAYAAAIDTGEV
jgi:hypothetical protein